MDFDKARELALAELDSAHAGLRGIAADRTWTNEDFKEYKEALTRYYNALKRANRLNVVELESK